MKNLVLSKEQREELEKFGANTWFVEQLYSQFQENPNDVPEQWRKFFGHDSASEKGNGSKNLNALPSPSQLNIKMPKPGENDKTSVLAGSSARIVDNMNDSLSIPVATTLRSIPVKLLEENRILINQHLAKKSGKKVSFTHVIAWAIIQALKNNPSLNNFYTIVEGKHTLVKRDDINIGIAIDIEKKDGSRSLIVPNLKKVNELTFSQFLDKYDDLVARSRKGAIDPSEFFGSTITLTNPGTIGTIASVPRLMLGQGTIIATGAIQYPAEYQAMSPATISQLGISKVMNITSTYDHRIIQGAESGLFLKDIHELLLGKNNFYNEIFTDLKIPLVPIIWETDFQPSGMDSVSNSSEVEKQARVLQLINMYRVRGHLIANLDPLGTQNNYHPELDPSTFKFTMWDFDRYFITGGLGGYRTATLREIINILQKTYCEKIGIEYMHMQSPAEKAWLQSQMEPIMNIPSYKDEEKIRILKKLIQAENFEHYIHNKFVGHKRFSLEGSETIIPLLDHILNIAAEQEVKEIVLGMAHRGRLNILANIIGKDYESIFSEFEDIVDPNSIEGSGDVKYHLGASGEYETIHGKPITVSVASNPSHLEWVNPVVEGIVRAKQTRMNDTERKKIIPLLIHGDAAFAGQGVVAETLNLSQLPGYRTGGTIHVIINNQIGFTTTPEEARSTVYASDVAKMVQAPIFHVNGDDPEASLWVAKLAYEYRQKFKKDVVIDLFGYRRHGHNEGDEPGFTQPLLYEKIKNHPSVRTIYGNKLVSQKTINAETKEKFVEEHLRKLDEALEIVKKKKSITFMGDTPLAVSKEKIDSAKLSELTNISEKLFEDVVKGITSIPEGFTIHPKLVKFIEKRAAILTEDSDVDWAFAESLAYGSLLLEGTPVRLSGQDSVRGTFSHRHLAFLDINTAEEYFPLKHLSEKQANFEVYDSLLSEAAVLGFEFGYSSADPLALVMWEAQFGDFANSAQVIIDNFIVCSYEKWKQRNNVVLLLPHGFEGQGPEHSSARLERFLILCAQQNMEVCNLTTPAQYFHLLRRHIKKGIRRPLIIMAPKSLLRHAEARSKKDDFIHGQFREIIDDLTVEDKNSIERIILTSGKVYYELLKYRKDNKFNNTAIVRVEQIYPTSDEMMIEILNKYKNAKAFVWVQEEPRNMGAWNFLAWRIQKGLKPGHRLKYSGRPDAASPAVGSSKISNKQQAELIEKAFLI